MDLNRVYTAKNHSNPSCATALRGAPPGRSHWWISLYSIRLPYDANTTKSIWRKRWVTLRELVWLLQHDMITSTTSAEEKPSHKANIAYWVAWGHPAFALTSSNSHNFAEILRPWFCYSTPVQRQPSCEHTRRDPNKNAWEEHEVSALIWKKISSSTDLPKSKWNQIWNFQAHLLVDPSKADKFLISTYDLWMCPSLKSHCEWLSSNISKSWKPSETRFNLFIPFHPLFLQQRPFWCSQGTSAAWLPQPCSVHLNKRSLAQSRPGFQLSLVLLVN